MEGLRTNANSKLTHNKSKKAPSSNDDTEVKKSGTSLGHHPDINKNFNLEVSKGLKICVKTTDDSYSQTSLETLKTVVGCQK